MELSTTVVELEQSENPPPQDLQFVNYPTNSAPRPSRNTRAVVRSHVTRRQHRQRLQSNPFRPFVTKPGARSTTSSTGSATQSDPPSRESPRASSSAETSSEEKGYATNPSSNASDTSLSVSPVLGSTQEDPFWTFPIDYSPLFPPIIAHYIHNLALPVTDLDGPSQAGLLRTHWFPMAMMSSASMYSLLLMAASHYCRAFDAHEGGPETAATSIIQPQAILVLKARALEEVNRCLRSEDIRVAVGDTTIGAVAKLAAFEAVFGDEAAYRQHMLGLSRMLQVRRALGDDTIGPLDQFLARLVTWIDVNAAYFTGMSGQEILDLGVVIKEPDPLLFAGTTRCRSEVQWPGGLEV